MPSLTCDCPQSIRHKRIYPPPLEMVKWCITWFQKVVQFCITYFDIYRARYALRNYSTPPKYLQHHYSERGPFTSFRVKSNFSTLQSLQWANSIHLLCILRPFLENRGEVLVNDKFLFIIYKHTYLAIAVNNRCI